MTLPAAIPVRRELDGSALPAWSSGLSWPAVVLIVLAVAWMGWLLWRKRRGASAGQEGAQRDRLPWTRFLGAGAPQTLQVTASSRLTPSHSVHELIWQGRHYLVACAAQDIRLLAEAPAASPDNGGASKASEGGGARV